jgi:hypothetical protein
MISTSGGQVRAQSPPDNPGQFMFLFLTGVDNGFRPDAGSLPFLREARCLWVAVISYASL